MLSLFMVLTVAAKAAANVKCFSCASADYRPIFERNSALTNAVMIPRFDAFCDSETAVQTLAPVDYCHSACITVFEPQYFGGLQSRHKPYLYIRGCAEKVFSQMESRPVEIDVLHEESICVSLQLSQIYPHVQANEIVQVCSCTINGCNFHTSTMNGSILPSIMSTFMMFILVLLI